MQSRVGTKLWRLAYRFNGKQKLLAFGVYPTVSLADARARRDAAKKILADGVDPSVQRKLEKQARVPALRCVLLRLCLSGQASSATPNGMSSISIRQNGLSLPRR
jgi:hypothetical protein